MILRLTLLYRRIIDATPDDWHEALIWVALACSAAVVIASAMREILCHLPI